MILARSLYFNAASGGVDRTSTAHAQVAVFDLTRAAPQPTYVNVSAAVPGENFEANAVRVVQTTSTASYVLVGGRTSDVGPTFSGLLVHGSIAFGSTEFHVLGSTVLPSLQSGVTALSQTSALRPGFVIAATDEGLFKCVHIAAPNTKENHCFSAYLSQVGSAQKNWCRWKSFN